MMLPIKALRVRLTVGGFEGLLQPSVVRPVLGVPVEQLAVNYCRFIVTVQYQQQLGCWETRKEKLK